MNSTAVIIGYVWPEPDSSAAGRHMLEIISVLQNDNYKIVFASAAAASAYQFDLSSLGIEEHTIELNSDSFDRWLVDINPALVIFDRFFTEEQFGWRVEKSCPQAMRVLDTEDLHFLRDARFNMLKQPSADAADNRYLLDSDMAYREIASIYRSDLTLIISEAEMQLLTGLFALDPALLHYFPMLAEHTAGKPASGFAQRRDFVFVGTMRHRPNLDAVRLLKKQLWPLIRQQLASVNLFIAGSYPTKEVSQMHKPAEGFHVLGHVQDLPQVLHDKRVYLAPLMFGAGLKGKLLEAMQYGIPSVTTETGAEGIADREEWPGYVCDDLQKMAQKAVELYQDETGWAESQLRGYELLARRFAPQQHANALSKAINRIRGNLDWHRRNNFTGRMLQHHLHASTQYMSRWIECKNRNT